MVVKNRGRKYGIASELTYEMADWTDSSAAVVYVGYLSDDGGWIIKKIDTTSMTVRWARGVSGYAAAWTGRAGKTYDLYNTIF